MHSIMHGNNTQLTFLFFHFTIILMLLVFSRPWKFEHMATDLLSLLLREDHPLPPDAVLYFTQSLVHDSISIRKVCSCVYTACLSEFMFLWTKCSL